MRLAFLLHLYGGWVGDMVVVYARNNCRDLDLLGNGSRLGSCILSFRFQESQTILRTVYVWRCDVVMDVSSGMTFNPLSREPTNVTDRLAIYNSAMLKIQ